MLPARRAGLAGLVVAVLFVGARFPLHRVTYALPVSNDDAIPLLMARHVLRGEPATILWNQPYNGTLDTYLLAPGLLVGDAHSVFRAYEVACALGLVVLAGALAREVAGAAAGLAAAALAAVGSPYMALMAATGPTPNFLVPVLVAVPVLVGMRAGDSRRTAVGLGSAALAGVVSGLVVWDSALAVPALGGAAAGLVAMGLRPRARPILACAAGLLVGLSPLLVAGLVGASASSPVTAVRPPWLWRAGLADLAHALAGLFGLQVPLVVDGPERAALPLLAVVALAVALLAALVAGASIRPAWPLVGWASALVVTFTFSRRTGADEVRYLYGLTVPVLALAGVGLARIHRRAPPAALIAALAIAIPWTWGTWLVTARWGDPAHASAVWQVPPLGPVLDTLGRAGVTSAYASLQFAGRLALESDEAIETSQAWNERIPGDPLRFRDEVDLDPRPAWVLSSHLSRGMPRAARFREMLAAIGGSAHEDLPGEFSVFRAFRPPFDEGRPVPREAFTVAAAEGTPLPAATLDRDGRTVWTSPRAIAKGSGIVVTFASTRRLSAVVFQVALDPSPLGTRWVCEVDGALVASGPMDHALQWVNGAPRAGRQALFSVVLPGVPARQVRILFQEAGPPLGIAEVFAYGPDETAREPAGAGAAAAAYAALRRGDWDEAVRLYREAVRLEPDRASYYACLARAEWRAPRRRHLDVESLDDGGPALVDKR